MNSEQIKKHLENKKLRQYVIDRINLEIIRGGHNPNFMKLTPFVLEHFIKYDLDKFDKTNGV